MAKIRHIALFTDNVEELAKFYVETFGMEITQPLTSSPESGSWVFLTDGYIDMALIQPAKAEEGKNGINHFGFTVDPEERKTILEKLKKAAYGGLSEAQIRYGWFVTGYYATDEMFWPHDRETAIGALGLLRFAVQRDPASAEDYPGLDQTPPDPNSAFIQLLDPEWLRLAVEEASAYEACVEKQAP
jgi:catechol 2,3-dioxygenase-like lactoylglutathione lyase family enzyme